MNKLKIVALILAFSSCIILSAPCESQARHYTQLEFSPSPKTVRLITSNISKAKEDIKVAAYSFTSEPITKALIAAHDRGVKVEVVADKSQAKDRRSAVRTLAEHGIPVRINRKYAIMHNKFMVIDGKIVQTGSFNYTKSAEKRNAENVLVIRNNPYLAKKYLTNWRKLWDEAEEFLWGTGGTIKGKK
jgi:phosphatidylserine/phosphatidylglycerophosphate/cardiolipin synthase-like enzyme